MKRYLFLLLAAAIWAITSTAQVVHQQENNYRSARGTVHVSMSDRSLMVVSINGRKYDKVASALTIRDMPPGRNIIEIYRFIPNRNRQGGTAQLVHRGTLRVHPQYFYEVVYDVRTRRLYIDKSQDMPRGYGYDDRATHRDRNDDSYYDDRNQNGHYQPGYEDERNNNDRYRGTPSGMDSRRFESLKTRMDKSIGDSGKFKLFESEMKAVPKISVAQLAELIDMLSFDSSKIDFAKAAYRKLSDPHNAYSLEEKFSFESTKEEFRQLINGR